MMRELFSFGRRPAPDPDPAAMPSRRARKSKASQKDRGVPQETNSAQDLAGNRASTASLAGSQAGAPEVAESRPVDAPPRETPAAIAAENAAMTEGSGPEALARQSAGTSTAAMGQPTEPPASPLSTRIRNAWWDSSPKATDGSKDARTRSRFSWFRSGASGRKSDADRGRTSRKPARSVGSAGSAAEMQGRDRPSSRSVSRPTDQEASDPSPSPAPGKPEPAFAPASAAVPDPACFEPVASITDIAVGSEQPSDAPDAAGRAAIDGSTGAVMGGDGAACEGGVVESHGIAVVASAHPDAPELAAFDPAASEAASLQSAVADQAQRSAAAQGSPLCAADELRRAAEGSDRVPGAAVAMVDCAGGAAQPHRGDTALSQSACGPQRQSATEPEVTTAGPATVPGAVAGAAVETTPGAGAGAAVEATPADGDVRVSGAGQGSEGDAQSVRTAETAAMVAVPAVTSHAAAGGVSGAAPTAMPGAVAVPAAVAVPVPKGNIPAHGLTAEAVAAAQGAPLTATLAGVGAVTGSCDDEHGNWDSVIPPGKDADARILRSRISSFPLDSLSSSFTSACGGDGGANDGWDDRGRSGRGAAAEIAPMGPVEVTEGDTRQRPSPSHAPGSGPTGGDGRADRRAARSGNNALGARNGKGAGAGRGQQSRAGGAQPGVPVKAAVDAAAGGYSTNGKGNGDSSWAGEGAGSGNGNGGNGGGDTDVGLLGNEAEAAEGVVVRRRASKGKHRRRLRQPLAEDRAAQGWSRPFAQRSLVELGIIAAVSWWIIARCCVAAARKAAVVPGVWLLGQRPERTVPRQS